MAINIDTVYKTVLLILNKEQRGYLTPDEFNKTATQVQLEIFTEYFEDLNQQLRVPDNDSEYADRIKNLQEKISIFEEQDNCTYSAGYFSMPTNLYKLGTLIYKDEKEIQQVQPNELLEINLSKLTKPTELWPVFNYGKFKAKVYPATIIADVSATYVRKPLDPKWNFTVSSPNYQYIFSPSTSINFELHETEQTNVITKILLYSGVIVKDPQIVQIAAQEIQSETVNSKS